jgi:hypothetical protein
LACRFHCQHRPAAADKGKYYKARAGSLNHSVEQLGAAVKLIASKTN